MKGPPINWWWDWDRPKTNYMSTGGGFSRTDLFHWWSCPGFERNKIMCLSKAGTWWWLSLPYTVIPWYPIASQKMFVLIISLSFCLGITNRYFSEDILVKCKTKIQWRYFSFLSVVFKPVCCTIGRRLRHFLISNLKFSNQTFPQLKLVFGVTFQPCIYHRQNAGLKRPTKLRTTQFIWSRMPCVLAGILGDWMRGGCDVKSDDFSGEIF